MIHDLKRQGLSISAIGRKLGLDRIQRHQVTIGERSVEALSTATSEQWELSDTLNLPEPA